MVDETQWDDDYRCSQFACVDPSAPCVDDDSVTVDMIGNCYTGAIGDGWCDEYNNNENCGESGLARVGCSSEYALHLPIHS